MNLKKKKDIITLLQIFVFSGIFGFIYEEIFYLFDLGKLVKRGTTFGPWIPIYGFGSIFITLMCFKYKEKPLVVFLLGTLISGIVEFFSGYIIYHVFNTRLWDYNVEILNFGNIGGYICLRSVLFFGISSMFLFYMVLPILNKINKSDNKIINIISIVLFIIFVLDILLSCIF